MDETPADVAEEIVEAAAPLIADPVGILAVLLGVLAILFWFGEQRAGKKLFGIVPKLVFCYFVPTTLTTLGVLPDDSVLYSWIKIYLLPASLLLLILALDVPGIVRLGPKAIIMLLAGTFGVVLGAPLALLIFVNVVPPDTWQGMTALCGSWIGGGANMVALGQIAECPDELFGKMIIVDVFIANIWMGVLLYGAGRADRIDKWTGADNSALKELQQRVEKFQERTQRIPTLTDLIIIVAFGFIGAYLAFLGGNELGASIGTLEPSTVAGEAAEWKPFLSPVTWKFILITTVGVILSFTRARNLDGAGASKVGSVMLYLLVASIGAHADFRTILGAPILIAVGAVWMLVHIAVLLGIGKLIRAPFFYVAVGSQANIGGAASAPVVASAFHPTLAPVGVLLAVAGYVLGTYAGLLCMWLLQLVAGA